MANVVAVRSRSIWTASQIGPGPAIHMAEEASLGGPPSPYQSSAEGRIVLARVPVGGEDQVARLFSQAGRTRAIGGSSLLPKKVEALDAGCA